MSDEIVMTVKDCSDCPCADWEDGVCSLAQEIAYQVDAEYISVRITHNHLPADCPLRKGPVTLLGGTNGECSKM